MPPISGHSSTYCVFMSWRLYVSRKDVWASLHECDVTVRASHCKDRRRNDPILSGRMHVRLSHDLVAGAAPGISPPI